MHDYYGDAYNTGEHCWDLMQEADRERQIRDIDKTRVGHSVTGKPDLRPLKIVLEIVEKDQRITVEVR